MLSAKNHDCHAVSKKHDRRPAAKRLSAARHFLKKQSFGIRLAARARRTLHGRKLFSCAAVFCRVFRQTNAFQTYIAFLILLCRRKWPCKNRCVMRRFFHRPHLSGGLFILLRPPDFSDRETDKYHISAALERQSHALRPLWFSGKSDPCHYTRRGGAKHRLFWGAAVFRRPFCRGTFWGRFRSQRLAFSRCAWRIFWPRLFSTAYALALPALAKGTCFPASVCQGLF